MKLVPLIESIYWLSVLLCQPCNANIEMVPIPAGTNNGTDPDFGAYSLTVNAFYMDRMEVTKSQWDEVYTWAVAHGYGFDSAGSGKAMNHPVQTVNWYDCVKWCNARSEMEGRAACYHVSGGIYRTNASDAVVCDANIGGYRLPTDVEWQYAARGGLSGHRYSWGDTETIDHSRANYFGFPVSSGGRAYDLGYSGYDTNYNDSVSPFTSPVGSFAPNGYGLYDMAGNVYEWCFDWLPGYEGSRREICGGGWDDYPDWCRVALSGSWPPAGGGHYDAMVGLRAVRSSNVNDGLVAYYPFNGNANDVSGNGNNGIVYAATQTTNRFGAQNSAYYFDGLSSRIFVADSASLTLTNSLTLAAFINADYPQNENAGWVIFRGDDRNALDPYSLALIDGNKVLFLIDDAQNNSISLQAPISPTEWHQVVGTLDGGNGQMRLYIDGILVASTNAAVRPFGLLTGPQPGLGIGHLQSDNPSFKGCFKGILDDIRIYNRAITSAEVIQLYTSGGEVTPQTSISNIRASQRAQTRFVDIFYNLTSTNRLSFVSVSVSTNNGATYDLPAPSMSNGGSVNSIGTGVAPGQNKWVTWNAGVDWGEKYSDKVRFKVIAINQLVSPQSLEER